MKSLTRIIADEIMADLEDRKGILDGVDDETKAEIVEAFAKIIDSHLALHPDEE